MFIANKPGYIRDWLKVKVNKNTELFIPVAAHVSRPGVNFVQEDVNMGVISSLNNFEHEYVAQIYNTASYPFEIVDILIQITPEYNCFNVHLFSSIFRPKTKSLIISPFEKPTDLLKLSLFGSESNEAKVYAGKIILLLRNISNGQNDTVNMSFSFSEY